MAGRNNQKGGLSVLWIPRRKHGHKKEKFYKPHAEKPAYRGSGSGMFPNGSPYSRRKHQEDPILPIAGGSNAPIPGTAGGSCSTSGAIAPGAPVVAAVVVEQQANGTAPPRTEPPLEQGDTPAQGGLLNAMTECKNSDKINRRNQEEMIEMADDSTTQVLGSIADTGLFMDNTNNNKSNGHLDRVDSAIMRKKKKKRKSKKKYSADEKEDECGIKCLSYALQCCECTIS